MTEPIRLSGSHTLARVSLKVYALLQESDMSKHDILVTSHGDNGSKNICQCINILQ